MHVRAHGLHKVFVMRSVYGNYICIAICEWLLCMYLHVSSVDNKKEMRIAIRAIYIVANIM